jgi:hypothetical protein
MGARLHALENHVPVVVSDVTKQRAHVVLNLSDSHFDLDQRPGADPSPLILDVKLVVRETILRLACRRKIRQAGQLAFE